MQIYHDMLRAILRHGRVRPDRTGTGTLGIFGYQNRHRHHAHYLTDGSLAIDNFPLLTTKKVSIKNIVTELEWFLHGDTNIEYLLRKGCRIWTDWPLKYYNQQNPNDQMEQEQFEAEILAIPGFAKRWGDCGPVYGQQWRAWEDPKEEYGYPSIDQLDKVIAALRENPFSRRHIVSAWNAADIDEMAKAGLPPCHCLFQFNVNLMTIQERIDASPQLTGEWNGKNEAEITAILDSHNEPKYLLDLQLYQRSADSFLGVPYNIASYSMLLALVAQELHMVPGDLIHTFGDLHIYNNHREQVEEQLSREPRTLPTFILNPPTQPITTSDYSISYRLENYNPHDAIRAPIAV